MKSNGFGSFQQQIYVLVPDNYTNRIGEYESLAKTDDLTEFLTNLTTTRPGNDETVVYEIDNLLASLKVPRDAWSIDWNKSTY